MMTKQEQEFELKKEYDDSHTDRIDADFDIALFEYGIVRNPKTNDTVFCLTAGRGFKFAEHRIMISDVTLEDVQEDLNVIDDGYFKSIGSSLEVELKNLDNERLSRSIQNMDRYDGRYTAI